MGKRILIVDDAAFLRMQLKKIFTEAGATVVGEAANGEECIEKYEKLKPDLVTMDITMPDMDGITALKILKKKHPDAKVVMCSSMGQPEKFIQCIQEGALDFIVKPFQNDRVEALLKKI